MNQNLSETTDELYVFDMLCCSSPELLLSVQRSSSFNNKPNAYKFSTSHPSPHDVLKNISGNWTH